MGILPHDFDDINIVLLPRQPKLSHPIVFELNIANITPEITSYHAHIKLMSEGR